MFLTVLFPDRRRKQVVFGIIVNHCFGKNLVSHRVPGGAPQSAFHKCGYLVHIQVNIGDIVKTDVMYSVKTFYNAV